MTQAPFEQAYGLRIGTVEYVSPDRIEVALDLEAPESVALNAVSPRPFPRVNDYLLVPVYGGLLAGQIEWVTVEKSAFPKRRGMQDFGLIDLPYPLRKLRLNPLGMLREQPQGEYTFRRGADALPSVGEGVRIPTLSQLRSIIESGQNKYVKIGSSPIAGDAEVKVDPNRLFGRHLAVLGNTGSGKSCSVAGLIRWSLEEAHNLRGDQTQAYSRFLILDPNGEYSRAFSDVNSKIQARIFKVNPVGKERALKVPLWFWNSDEWCSFTQASTRVQRPLLRRALREVRAGSKSLSGEEQNIALRRYLSSRLISIRGDLRSGDIQKEESKFGFRLRAIRQDLEIKQTANIKFRDWRGHNGT